VETRGKGLRGGRKKGKEKKKQRATETGLMVLCDMRYMSGEGEKEKKKKKVGRKRTRESAKQWMA